ncbi:peptidyl-dipeptidase Dcp [Formosa sp. L2A11]|uniref:peptidyl-dipeptidase Dcp n=1 Tax=Formosa sp. L2A11 TaxID=2686363 RepID=UPI00131C559F|nr:peptidyl-dipeptidase Dcp [Formosa sp. L2A11]
MKQLSVFALFAVVILTTSCQKEAKKVEEVKDELSATNPFFAPSDLPFQAPDFDKIKNTDFLPAMDAGMKAQLKEIKAIVENPEAPTFENTFVSLEKTGQLLMRVNNVFNLLSGANTNPELQEIEEVSAPKFAEHNDAIYLNPLLFARVKTVYDSRDSLKLDPESMHLVEYYYQRFVLAGANLNDADKIKLRELNSEVASLSAKFTNQLLAAAKAGALVVDNKEALAGLSDAEISAAANDTNTEWTLPLQNTTQQPSLQNLTNRETREKLFTNSWTRASKGDENDTRKTIERIAVIRAEQASILGYENYAAWKLQNQMAKTPKAVQDFLDQLVPATVAKAKVEAADIQALIDKQKGGFKLEAWDWNMYAEQVRKERYDLDDSQIKPYFELYNVLENGVFYAANQLYGLTFKERKDLPVYQEDVRVYDVIDKDGTQIGLFYGDYFKRDNKSGGAWMSNIVEQSKLLGTQPVIYNVCNFTKPADGEPALVSFDDVITMFHEFGHALHGFFANQEYVSLSGTNTPRDFVEFPSQFNENWALYPTILNNYAKHYKTGEPMPQALIDKIKKASTFNQGYALTEVLSAASLDMQWHTISKDVKIDDADVFEKEALKRTHLDLSAVPPRYRSTYFLHIWGNGYAAGYYAYLWTEMLDHDAFAWFENHGGLTPENGQRFRDMILSRGNTEEFGKLYRDFTGEDPKIEPMLKSRGLTE